MEKICSRCKTLKSLDEFGNLSKSKDGKKYHCKECVRIECHKRFLSKKEHINQVNKKWRDNNKSKYLENCRNYYKKNSKRLNENARKWQNKNKEHIRQYINERNKNRKLSDPLYKLTASIRSQLHKILRNKTENFEFYIGCSGSDYLKHLNNNKYGFKYGDKGLDIDHIIPLSKAKNEKELISLLHYSNTQLLPAYYNRHIKKGNDYDKNNFEKWLKTLK